jgi:hypothetical protein
MATRVFLATAFFSNKLSSSNARLVYCSPSIIHSSILTCQVVDKLSLLLVIVRIKVSSSVEQLPWIAYYWLMLQLLRDWVQLGCHFTPHHLSFKAHWFAIETAIGNVVIGRSVCHHFIHTRLGLIAVNNGLPLLSRLILYDLSVLRQRFENVFFESRLWSEVRNWFVFCLRVCEIRQSIERSVVCNFTFTRYWLAWDVFTCRWIEFLIHLLLSSVIIHFARKSLIIFEKLLSIRFSILLCTLSSVFSFRLVKIFKWVIFFEWLRSCLAFCTRLLMPWERLLVYKFLRVGLGSYKFIR